MIEQIQDLPANVVGFRGTGKITKNEYDSSLLPAVDMLADSTGSLRYLFVLDSDVSNISTGAWYDDIKVGLEHLLQWKKIAIVSDQKYVNKFTQVFGTVMPGEVRAFTLSELDEAKKWVAE